MGTSTGYSAPPSWGPLKNEVTRAATAGSLTPATARHVLQHFIRENGGAAQVARGGGGVVGKGRTAQAVAGRLGGFISDVGRFGLTEALTRSGLADLIGRPISEILNGLVDKLGGPASTIDEVDARNALARLNEKILGEAENAEDVERILAGQAAHLEPVLQDFFGFYLFELFCRVFFERLVQRIGEFKAQSFLDDIEHFLDSTLLNRTTGRDLSGINWGGPEGQAIVADIMENTLTVFEA
jgi:hypothetical protein